MIATDDLNFSPKEKLELQSEINLIHEQVKKGEITHEKLGALLDRFEQSQLPLATRI